MPPALLGIGLLESATADVPPISWPVVELWADYHRLLDSQQSFVYVDPAPPTLPDPAALEEAFVQVSSGRALKRLKWMQKIVDSYPLVYEDPDAPPSSRGGLLSTAVRIADFNR